jgi:maleate isomerase
MRRKRLRRVAITTATYWHALRAVGIQDRVAGFGTLLTAH